MTLHTLTGKPISCLGCTEQEARDRGARIDFSRPHTWECIQHTDLPKRGYVLNPMSRRWERPDNGVPSGNWAGGGFTAPDRESPFYMDEVMEDYGIGDR